MKRYSMGLVSSPEGFIAHKMLELLGGGYVLYDDAMAEIGKLRAENALLRELLGAWYSDVSIPGPNCSCHISPPCNDCVEWGGLREAAEQTKRILGVKS